jgi:GntP family gluconate:H+ symporter
MQELLSKFSTLDQWLTPGQWLLVYAAISIIALILLIARYRLNPFITLTLVSLGLGLMAGIPAKDVVFVYEAGVGKTLGHIALVVALGTMLGKMMAESGGAEQIARTMIRWFGEKNVHWAMVFIAFLVGFPIFFEVGFVLLIPIAFNVARRTGTSMLLVGLPMVAGLSVVHGLVPPHPAAMIAVGEYQPMLAAPFFMRCWWAFLPPLLPGLFLQNGLHPKFNCLRTIR